MTFDELLLKHNKQKKEIAVELDISRDTLRLWVKNQDMPLNKAAKLSNHLQVSIKVVVESILFKQYSVFEA